MILEKEKKGATGRGDYMFTSGSESPAGNFREERRT